jgi:hypothetical protein
LGLGADQTCLFFARMFFHRLCFPLSCKITFDPFFSPLI